MFTNYTNMNMLNMNGMFGMNSCGSNFFAGGCNNMFGSIFGFGNNAFYNSCEGTYDYDAMAGWGVASTLANIGLGILVQHLASKQAEKNQPSLSDQIADVDAEIQKEADRIGVDANQVESYDVSKSEYQTNVNDANTKHQDAIKAHEKSVGELTNLEHEQKTLNDKTEKNENDKKRLQELASNIATKKLEVERAKKAEVDAKLALDKANEELEAHKKTVKEVKTNVANLRAQKAKLVKQQEAQELAKTAKEANGNIFNRNKDLNVDTLFDQNGNFKTGADVTLADIRELVDRFKNLKDGDAKLKVAKALAGLTSTQLARAGAKTSHYNMQEFAKTYVKENDRKS